MYQSREKSGWIHTFQFIRFSKRITMQNALTVIVIRIKAPENDGSDLEDVERIENFLKEEPEVALDLDVNGVGAVEQPERRLQRLRETRGEFGPKPMQLLAAVVAVQPDEGLGPRVEDILDVPVNEKAESGLRRSPEPGPVVGVLVRERLAVETAS